MLVDPGLIFLLLGDSQTLHFIERSRLFFISQTQLIIKDSSLLLLFFPQWLVLTLVKLPLLTISFLGKTFLYLCLLQIYIYPYVCCVRFLYMEVTSQLALTYKLVH